MSVHRLHLQNWPSRVVAGYTTRDGGMSAGSHHSLNLGLNTADQGECVIQNRRRLRQALPELTDVQYLSQVHGTRVIQASHSGQEPQADACWTTESRIACAVLTADCLPILLCCETGATVAAVHAGWRGLAGGIVEATLAALPTPPAQLLAWLGPCIGPCHFRVGEDVADVLEKSLSVPVGECFQKSGDGGVMVDLQGLAARQLRAAGVSRVSASEHCTFCAKARYFSYRRDGETGRMAAFIARI